MKNLAEEPKQKIRLRSQNLAEEPKKNSAEEPKNPAEEPFFCTGWLENPAEEPNMTLLTVQTVCYNCLSITNANLVR